MSDKKHSDTIIRNEDTLRRRAWIERALTSVREKLPFTDQQSNQDDHQSEQDDSPEDSFSDKPQLYVVNSERSR